MKDVLIFLVCLSLAVAKILFHYYKKNQGYGPRQLGSDTLWLGSWYMRTSSTLQLFNTLLLFYGEDGNENLMFIEALNFEEEDHNE